MHAGVDPNSHLRQASGPSVQHRVYSEILSESKFHISRFSSLCAAVLDLSSRQLIT